MRSGRKNRSRTGRDQKSTRLAKKSAICIEGDVAQPSEFEVCPAAAWNVSQETPIVQGAHTPPPSTSTSSAVTATLTSSFADQF
jgi:hypothetical protein